MTEEEFFDLICNHAGHPNANLYAKVRINLKELEHNLCQAAYRWMLERNRGNISKTARDLGINRMTVYNHGKHVYQDPIKVFYASLKRE